MIWRLYLTEKRFVNQETISIYKKRSTDIINWTLDPDLQIILTLWLQEQNDNHNPHLGYENHFEAR